MAERFGDLRLLESFGGLTLNLVLLGKIGAGKSASGNTILGREAFTSKKSFSSVTQDVAVESGTVGGRRVTVYDTPGLFNTKLSEQEIQQIYANVLQRCESCPCVFLLVIKADRFTRKERETVEKIEELLGEERLKKTWILFTRGDELEEEKKSIDEFINETEPLKKLVQKYDQRYHVFNNKPKGQVQELLTKIYSTYPDTIGAKPKGTPVESLEGFHSRLTEPQHLRPAIEAAKQQLMMMREQMWPCEEKGENPLTLLESLEGFHSRDIRSHCWSIDEMMMEQMSSCEDSVHILLSASRRIVLLGQTGVGKSAAGNTILGQREFISIRSTKSVTSKCSDAHATVSGRHVSVVDTPGLYHTQVNPEQLRTEIMRSVYLSSPGPHTFIIVFPVNMRFTDQELQIPQMIEMIFGEEVLKYSFILFTHGDQLEEGETIEELIDENSRLRDVVGECGGRFHVFNNTDENNRDQVNDLLQKIDTMIEQNGGGHYSNQMLEDAERLRREEEERKLQEEKQRREEIERVRKETEENIRAEFEGPPRFLQERLKSIRRREEHRKRQLEELEGMGMQMRMPMGMLMGMVMEMGMVMGMGMEMRMQMQTQREEKQIQDDIERVIKETKERVRAEFDGAPTFLLERVKSILRQQEEKRVQEEIESGRIETEEEIVAELLEGFKSMRLREEEERKQREEKQRREEIESVRKETEERVRAEFEGPPRFLQERIKAMCLSVEEKIRRFEEHLFDPFYHPHSSRRKMDYFKYMDYFMHLCATELACKREEIERVIKETGEKIRAEFKGPPT